MSDTHHAAGDHGDAAAHQRHYIKIWAILMVLLFVSIAGPFVGSAVNLRIVTLITAFGVAFVKAYLVAKNFMHVNMERPIIWYALGSALVIMVLFFSAVSPDVMNHEGSRWVNVAAKAESERREAAHEAGMDIAHHEEGGEGHGAEGGAHEGGGTEAK